MVEEKVGGKKSFQNLLNHCLHVSVPSDRTTVVFLLNEFRTSISNLLKMQQEVFSFTLDKSPLHHRKMTTDKKKPLIKKKR